MENKKLATEEKSMLSERVKRLKERLLESRPQLTTERGRALLDVYREYAGQPIPILRAKVFERYLETMEIAIDENPIVGNQSKYPVGFSIFPEPSCEWMMSSSELMTASGKDGVIAEQDEPLVKEVIDYWKDKCLRARAKKVWAEKYPDIDVEDHLKAGSWIDGSYIPKGRFSGDYGKVMNEGLENIIREVQEELNKLPISSMDALRKRYFYNAVIISLNAVINLARRYASLAEDMSKKETDPERKAELERIAETCRWVPAKPARSFYEAIQSYWFTHLAIWLEWGGGEGICPGRFPLYMYPFYKKDKELGNITEEDAIELLELLFLKHMALTRWRARISHEWQQASTFQNMSLGGVTVNGEDATNDIDYLLIEAQKRIRAVQPTLSLLYHDRLPEDLLMKALELVKTGHGMPAFFNNDLNIQALLAHGVSLPDARNHCIIGCVERGYSHTADSMAGLFMSLPKCLEYVLYNGRDPVTGKQLGLKTGDAAQFKSYDELHQAIMKQHQYIQSLQHAWEWACNGIKAELFTKTFTSALVDDCIKRGKDMESGGARYSMDGCGGVGIIDLADALAAIKKLVFEEKAVTIKEMINALKANFEGYEELRHKCLQAPKYGNDDVYVDSIARQWYDIYVDEHDKLLNHYGAAMKPTALSVTAHRSFGERTGALPNGRKAHMPYADASISPEAGMDRCGPTAVVMSATRAIDTIRFGCGQLNMKFHPSAVEGKAGSKKLLALIKTYLDLGGHHIQFNVVSAETLRKAKAHPENYRDLVVRVVGFSAYFVLLDSSIQDEIISRNELRF